MMYISWVDGADRGGKRKNEQERGREGKRECEKRETLPPEGLVRGEASAN